MDASELKYVLDGHRKRLTTLESWYAANKDIVPYAVNYVVEREIQFLKADIRKYESMLKEV